MNGNHQDRLRFLGKRPDPQRLRSRRNAGRRPGRRSKGIENRYFEAVPLDNPH